MPTPVQPASPSAVRVDAAEPRPWEAIRAAAVVHVGRSVVVLDAGRQVVIGDRRFGLAPGGMQLADHAFARLKDALRPGAVVALNHWRPDRVGMADLRVLPRPVRALPVIPVDHAADHPMSPARIRSRAGRLVAATESDVSDTLAGLIGAGPGSTPTGDDVVVGVLAGLRAAGDDVTASRIARDLGPMLDRTTSASALYLRAAADGRFADRVHELLAGLATPQAAKAAVARAASWGATSGLDLLCGIVAGAAPAMARAAA